MAIKKQIRDEISSQAIQEISFARNFKQGKIRNWQKNEDMYYGRKVQPESSRANVDLNRMQEFVNTLLSKIDNPLIFKFLKRKASQVRRADRINALRTRDANKDDWDIKDIAGKKQAIIYGRAIYSYYADSVNGYQPHLDNVDVYDFLIDPSAGGIDIERAMFIGRYGIIKTKEQLKEGVKKGFYLREETTNLINGAGNADESTQEKTNRNNRTIDQNVFTSQKDNSNPDKYVFWEWYTTYKGERYYLLFQENSGSAIRVEKLTNIFSPTKEAPMGMWPFWSWASFIDLTEFWSISYCDCVRDIFQAQNVSVNQMLDNAEQINKPMKFIHVNAIEDLSQLKYRRDGYIKVKGDSDVNRSIQVVETPSINTPIQVFDILEGIQQKVSGVTDGAKGVEDTDGRATIYEGNQAATADRFGLLNKSYSFGYKRFAKLYEIGVKDHLTKKVAIDILGANGAEIEKVGKSDIFRRDDEFGLMVESSNAELALSQADKDAKIKFLYSQSENQMVNQKKLFEMEADISGFSEDQIKELLDTEDFGGMSIMSEAERDIESILDGKDIAPNEKANIAYKKRFVDYMQDHQEDISNAQFRDMADYILKLDEIIVKNMVSELNNKLLKEKMAQASQPEQPQESGVNPTASNQPEVPTTEEQELELTNN
jgi:hypothetical protein